MTGTIVVELKNKLTELEGRIGRLSAELASAEDQRSAFIKVISAYDPTFVDEATQRPDTNRVDDLAAAFPGIVEGT
jgi:hypothetical protein